MTTIVAPPWEEQPTVGGIVAASALPLPDVWVPFSDSLRMITGYGRDVLVGSDVVAKMVNFSRNSTATYIGKDGLLKTAAVNEPRFEKEGLLIEGQSTNLIPRSQQSNWLDGYGASPAVQSPNTDPQTSSLITTIDVTAGRRRPFISGILTVGKTYTISFRAKSDDGAISQVASQLTGAVYPAVAPGEWKTYSFTGVATGTTADFQITGTSVSIAWIQVEELPFASSYIPTNGAAATRAAEIINIPASGNFPWGGVTSSGELTIAFNVKAAGDLPPAGVMNIVSFEGQYSYNGLRLREVFGKTYFSALISGFNTNETSIPVNPKINNLVGVRITPTKVSVFANGNIKEVVGTLNQVIGTLIGLGTGLDGRILYGNIRNLRIWHKFLPDEQIKAIA